jgi:hypothetical protein
MIRSRKCITFNGTINLVESPPSPVTLTFSKTLENLQYVTRVRMVDNFIGIRLTGVSTKVESTTPLLMWPNWWNNDPDRAFMISSTSTSEGGFFTLTPQEISKTQNNWTFTFTTVFGEAPNLLNSASASTEAKTVTIYFVLEFEFMQPVERIDDLVAPERRQFTESGPYYARNPYDSSERPRLWGMSHR